jgi:hypothetical protein
VELSIGFSRSTLLLEDSYVGDTGSLPTLSDTVAPDTTITEIKTGLVSNILNFKLYFKFTTKPTPREKLIN